VSRRKQTTRDADDRPLSWETLIIIIIGFRSDNLPTQQCIRFPNEGTARRYNITIKYYIILSHVYIVIILYRSKHHIVRAQSSRWSERKICETDFRPSRLYIESPRTIDFSAGLTSLSYLNSITLIQWRQQYDIVGRPRVRVPETSGQHVPYYNIHYRHVTSYIIVDVIIVIITISISTWLKYEVYSIYVWFRDNELNI